MIEPIHVEALRYLPGAGARLVQKTARVRLRVSGNRLVDPGALDWSEILPEQTRPWVAPRSERLSDWLAALTVAIQREARDAVWHGRVLDDDGEHLDLAVPYERESVFKDALQWAWRWLMVSVDSTAYRAWLEEAQAGGLPPNTLRFALAAYQRGWPVRVDGRMLHIGWGAARRMLDSSFSGQTSHLAARTARDKHLTSRLLHEAGLPVPPTARVRDWEGAQHIARQLGWPVVVKPADQDQGTAVAAGIRDETALRAAFDAAARFGSGAVIVEKHIAGDDHRLLVVQGRLLMATRRIPGGVTGDGTRTVAQLIETVNADPRRGTNTRSLLMRLTLDAEALACLVEQDLAPETVPAAGRFVHLRRTANISTGGSAEDVTAWIHPDNRRLAERAARIIGLDIAGVDFLCPDISRSWREVGGAICEVNAQPGFRPHWLGDPGRDINGEILDRLFAQHPPRIPTAAITGTNGKTTTARMLHHIWQTAGKVTGVCTTQGVWVGDERVSEADLAGFPGARIVLNDPSVEAAVLELPRKGLIRFGHPCDRYDVGALLNVQDDHIGVNGIDTLEQMAGLKAEVLERAGQAVVVNAEDARCLAMRMRAGCSRHVLVAREAVNPAVVRHRAEGGEAVYVTLQQGVPWIVLADGLQEIFLMPLHEIPATMNGRLRCNEHNALFAAALAWVQGVPLETIRRAMAGFHNSPEQNPERYNVIDGLPFQVLLDYGHNPDGLRELFELVSRWPVAGQRALVSIVGNRFRHHLETQIPWMLATFDRIYLSQDEAYFQKNAHGFGREDPLGEMLAFAQARIEPELRSGQYLMLSRDYRALLKQGLFSGNPGDLVVLLAESRDVLPLIERYRRQQPVEYHGA